MYAYTQNPLLDFVGLLAAIAAGYLFVSDPRSPVANWSLYARGAALAAVAFVTLGVLDRLLVFFSPVFNGVSTGAALFEFLGGLLLLASLVGVFLLLRGDLKIKLERPAPPLVNQPPIFSNPTAAPAADACQQCGSPLKQDALFCITCGARTQALA